jgi:hypothetical protein
LLARSLVGDGTVLVSGGLLPDFNFDTTAHALQERESSRFGRRLGIFKLEGCKSGAFVDGVAEDERLSYFSMVSFQKHNPVGDRRGFLAHHLPL